MTNDEARMPAVSRQRMITSAVIVMVFVVVAWFAVCERSAPPPPPESGKALIQKLESGN